MKAVLISIQPKWCKLIASGKKTIEVRKTKPKLETPFKAYIYETKTPLRWNKAHNNIIGGEGGRVIGEFVCDEVIKIGNYQEADYSYMLWVKDRKTTDELCKNACLDEFEIQDYLGANGGYGWHISELKIYNKPKGLGEFKHCGVNYHYNPPITRPPQSWCYVEGVDL